MSFSALGAIYRGTHTSFNMETMFVKRIVYSIIESVHFNSLNKRYVWDNENIKSTVLKTKIPIIVMITL